MFKFLLCTSALVVLAAATPFRDCGSTATVSELRVPGCNTLPCLVIRGQPVTIEIDFISKVASDAIDSDVSGTVAGITFPWPSPFPEGCSLITAGDCPLEDGEAITYTAPLDIDASWPAVSATANWKILDDNSNTLVCLQVPLTLI